MEKGGRKRIEKEETAENSGQKKRNVTKREEAGTWERRESKESDRRGEEV